MTKTNTKLSRILTTKSAKILASFLILVVLISSFAISSFADDQVVYQTIAPINFNDFGTYTAVAQISADRSVSLSSSVDGSVTLNRNYINNSDYYSDGSLDVLTKTYNGDTVSYITISFYCQYEAVYVNSQYFDNTQASSSNHANLDGAFEFVVFPVTNSMLPGGYKTYYFDLILSQSSAVEQAYQNGFDDGRFEGFNQGYSQATSSQGIQNIRDEAYAEGFADGREMTDSENLGANLLGDTLNAPMKALNNFVIYESTNGFQVTLGLVVGGAISLTLFIAFLKIFAGG